MWEEGRRRGAWACGWQPGWPWTRASGATSLLPALDARPTLGLWGLRLLPCGPTLTGLPPSFAHQNFLHKWDRRGRLQSLSGERETTYEMSTVELLFRCVGGKGLLGPGEEGGREVAGRCLL